MRAHIAVGLFLGILSAICFGLIGFGLIGFWWLATSLSPPPPARNANLARMIAINHLTKFHFQKWVNDPEFRPFVEEMTEGIEQSIDPGVTWETSFISFHQLDDGLEQSEFERAAIEKLRATPERNGEVLSDDEQTYVRKIVAVASCGMCHSSAADVAGNQAGGRPASDGSVIGYLIVRLRYEEP